MTFVIFFKEDNVVFSFSYCVTVVAFVVELELV
jgi:hypothetical protein